MIWVTSIWRLECSNRSKIRSAQKCHPCLRYVLLPMSPGWTLILMVGAEGFEPPTLCSQSRCATRLRYAPTRSLIVSWNGELTGLREEPSAASPSTRLLPLSKEDWRGPNRAVG